MAHSPGGFLEEDSWFHGNISREDAESTLQIEGDEGSFLVRESMSIAGDYAISVLSDGVVHHIQVQRHGEDAFFSLVECGVTIHGLDELIKYYQSTPAWEGGITLEKAIIKSPPPPDCRRHGRTNLLHRATKEGSTDIVQELVKSRTRSLDAKNEDGQTAVHLAAIQGLNNILSILIKAGANVNARDSNSCTALHYACINNLPETVQTLLEEGHANPQIRRNENGWVPMHEAASRGHIECVKILWQHYTPLRPRTLDGKLPIHLAMEGNQKEMIQYFDDIKSRRTLTNRDEWYHGTLGREETLKILQLAQKASPGNDPNTSYFLIRRHSSKSDVYVLTVLFQGHIYKYEINKEVNFYYIDDGPYLESLEHVVDHYSRWQDGLRCPLMVPVGPTQTFAQPPQTRKTSKKDSLELPPPPLPKRTALSSSPNTLKINKLCNDFSNNNLNKEEANEEKQVFGGGGGGDGMPLPPFSRERIPHELIQFGESLGGGEYGEVFQGNLTMGNSGVVQNVAIKTLKTVDEWTLQEFLREATVMMELEHEHIVRIIGITAQPNVYMVQELLSLGSLQAYLRDYPTSCVPDKDFPGWGHQIAKGMVYLQRKRLVHRDLAARNVLLSKFRVAKISDFGLSRTLGGGSDYYTASKGGRWPIKWYAPESCTYGTFSPASDVWSYGITLWEIYSFGLTPYGEETTGREVIEAVEKGERLEKPKHCPDKIYSVMKKCWNKEPDLRPKFTFLENIFAENLESVTPFVPSETHALNQEQTPTTTSYTTMVDNQNQNENTVANNLNLENENYSTFNNSVELIEWDDN